MSTVQARPPGEAPPGARLDVRFWPHLASADVASTRIRCLQVMRALAQRGWAVRLFDPGSAEAPDWLVLTKRYDATSIETAVGLRQRHGTRLVLDLCDNHFYAQERTPERDERAATLRRAVQAVDSVVCSSRALAAVVRVECPGLRDLRVIDDAVDPLALPQPPRGAAWWMHRLRLAAFRAWHRAAPGRRLVWFGQHGSSFAEAGMLDLQRVAGALAAHHARAPLTLTVISNRWRTFRRLARGWRFPALYLPWQAAHFGAALAQHDVALLPLTPNPFTLCKTSNRAITAFGAGLAVAADPMPAYDEIPEAVLLGDWNAGLGRLMDDPAERARRLEAGRHLIEGRHSTDAIGAAWAALLQEDVPA